MCEVLPSCVHSVPQMLAQQVLQLKKRIFFFFLLSLYHLKNKQTMKAFFRAVFPLYKM